MICLWYLNLSTYKTDVTFEQIIEEFDEKYQEALNSEEKEKYKYTYLKLFQLLHKKLIN